MTCICRIMVRTIRVLLPLSCCMKIEKLLLAFFAVLGGLIVAGVGFYLYQSTKTLSPSQIKTVHIMTPTPTTTPVVLVIDTPQDTSVTDNKTVTVTGRTDPKATVIISTDTSDQVITPSGTGAFSTTVLIGNDENYIHVTAVNSDGQEAEKVITITYSTENF